MLSVGTPLGKKVALRLQTALSFLCFKRASAAVHSYPHALEAACAFGCEVCQHCGASCSSNDSVVCGVQQALHGQPASLSCECATMTKRLRRCHSQQARHCSKAPSGQQAPVEPNTTTVRVSRILYYTKQTLFWPEFLRSLPSRRSIG